MADEYRVDLEQRIDRYKKMYLFGALRMFNSVMFVRQDRDGNWHATIRPYTGKNSAANGSTEESPEGKYPAWEE